MNGRKRQVVVDTMGVLLAILVHPANVADAQGAYATLAKLAGRFPRLRKLWADGASGGHLLALVAATWATWGWQVEVGKREPEAKGFVVQPRRWVGERTFGWLGRYRGLAKDDAQVPQRSETMVLLAMLRLMRARLDPTP